MARTGTITGVVGAMALAAGLLGSGSAGPAAGAVPAQAEPTLTTNTTVLELGTDLVVSGTGCLDSGGSATDHIVAVGLADPELPYQLEVPPVSLGQTAVEADGSWSIATAVAQPLPPGRWLLVAGCLALGDERSLEFTYDPTAVTITPPPVTGIRAEGDVLSFDNPCREQTSAPPFEPELTAFFRTPSTPKDDDVRLDAVAPIPTGTARAAVRVPASTPSGSYLLEVDCLAHRVDLPLAIFASTVDWAAAPSSTTNAVSAGPAPGPAVAAPAVDGAATYTG